MLEEKNRYKAVSIAMFCVATGLALLRIIATFIMLALEESGVSELAQEYIIDTVFTMCSQVVVCLIVPLLIYKFVQKRSLRQIAADANYKKTRWWYPLASVPLAIGCYMVTVIISVLWLSYIISTGYHYVPSTSVYPNQFNPALFILSVFLTGVLPAICEEFAMRGNFLTAMRHTYRSTSVILLSALAFGLFHQNIVQVFYTAFFGALAVVLVIKTGSVIPAMVIHFVNNTFSVYLGYDGNYGWGLSDLMDKILANIAGIIGFLIVGLGLVVGFGYLILRQAKKDNAEIPVLLLYKPTLRENAWLIGAIVITAMSTIVTYISGL